MEVRTTALVLVALGTLACQGDKSSLCELEDGGVTYCYDGPSISYCEDELGGTATESDSSDDPECEDLGYTVGCGGISWEEGSKGTVFVETQEDCDTLQTAQE